jgi:hypothetical protein
MMLGNTSLIGETIEPQDGWDQKWMGFTEGLASTGAQTPGGLQDWSVLPGVVVATLTDLTWVEWFARACMIT